MKVLVDKVAGKLIAATIVVLIWAAAARFVLGASMLPGGAHRWDTAALLFAAASLALLLLSILISFVAVVGYERISKEIERKVADAFKNESTAFGNEIIGRQYAAMAYPLLRFAFDAKTLEVRDQRLLSEAIDLYRIAIDKVPKEKKLLYLDFTNNLVFSLCLRNRDVDGGFVRSIAFELRDNGLQSQNYSMILTACRAMFRYGNLPQAREARDLLTKLCSDPTVGMSENERDEASAHLAWLRSQRPEV
jgi:hypothetical protein